MGAPSRNDKDAGQEAADALKTLLARIGEIFGVFDLSFFVAGSVCLGALLFAGYVFGVPWHQHVDLKQRAAYFVAAVPICYVLGLVCFAAGRGRRDDDAFYQELERHLHTFRLRRHYGRFLVEREGDDRTRRYKRLYTLLWAEVRQKPGLSASFNLLTRYWVLAAMCDGLFAAFSLWTALWAAWALPFWTGPHPPDWGLWGTGLLLFGFAAYRCRGEARRYGDYQMYEICATLAYEHGQEKATDPVDLAAPSAPVVALGESATPPVT